MAAVRPAPPLPDTEDQRRSAELLEAMVAERTQALREAQSRLAAIIDNEPECVKMLDADGRLLEINAAGLGMVEADNAAQVMGRCIYDVVAPEHLAAFRDLTQRVCRGERGTLEFEITGLKGTRRWMETHAVPFREEASGRTLLLGITRDVTQRKRAEEALRESEQLFQVFLDHLPANAWIRDSQMRYTYANRVYAENWRCAPEALLGRPPEDFFPPEIAQHFRDTDRKVREDGKPMQYFDSLPSGRWLKVKFPLPNGAVGGIGVDMSERTRLEEALRETERRLTERLMATQELERRRLADNLHDLIGQNLTALGIELGALRARFAGEGGSLATPRLDAMAGLLSDTIESIRGVMTELRPPALEEYGLVPAVRWYASVFSERTGMKVTTNVLADSPRLPPDAELAVYRILQEALTNAAKHSGGTCVEIAVTEHAGGIRLSVEDDGRGFDNPVGARSARRGGWGLPTMRERAEVHGGKLRIEFPDRGTRVVVEMPGAHAD